MHLTKASDYLSPRSVLAVGRDAEGMVVTTSTTDLVNLSLAHIWFLQQLHAKGVSLRRPSRKSVQRYTELWLPLVAEYASSSSTPRDNRLVLLAPPDVAWLWHCHRLAPLIYEAYTVSRFGMLLEVDAPFQFQDQGNCDASASALETRAAWSNKYPNEPFFLEEQEAQESEEPDRSLVGGFDLIGSAMRQRKFLWQISAPCFQDAQFLQKGQRNYYRFLALQADHPLVPTFQIDLLWHTHMLTCITDYNETCIKVRGTKFHHDDSFDDRTAGGCPDLAFRKTCELWKLTYGTEYRVPGAMYRGEPPATFYHSNWTPVCLATADSAAHIPFLKYGYTSSKELGLDDKWSDVLTKWSTVQEKWNQKDPTVPVVVTDHGVCSVNASGAACGGNGCGGGGCSNVLPVSEGGCGGGGCGGGGCGGGGCGGGGCSGILPIHAGGAGCGGGGCSGGGCSGVVPSHAGGAGCGGGGCSGGGCSGAVPTYAGGAGCGGGGCSGGGCSGATPGSSGPGNSGANQQ